jgi:ADP-heptose:LPS heptosyltransferase
VKKIEITLRKFLLQLLLTFTRKPKQLPVEELRPGSKILFIRLNRIGDALISTPLLNLMKRNTDYKISVLAAKSNHFIFSSPDVCDEVIVFDKKKNGLFALIKILNEKKFDAVIDLHDDVSSTVSYIIAFLKCKYKFGLKKGTEKLYSHTIEKLDPAQNHVVDRILHFSKLFGMNYPGKDLNIVFNPQSEFEIEASQFISRHFNNKKFLVGINISAGSEARFWGVDNFKKLIDELNFYDVNILIMCVEKDIKYATAIAGSSYPVYYNSSFNKFSAMIAKLDLLFTPDTSIVHIGSAYKKPVFGLYVKYNTADMIWSPYKSPFDCVITEEPTLKNVTFELVKEKFSPFFEKFYYEYSTKPD